MYRKSKAQELQRITGQAVEWLRVMRDEPSADERAEFTTWITLSQQHLQEFLVVTMLELELANVDSKRRFDVDKLIAAAMREPNVVPLAEGPVAASRPFKEKKISVWRQAAGFVAFAVALSAVWFMLDGSSGQHYSTATSEQRQFQLSDGSIVELNARSRVNVRLSSDARDLELLAGEALFKVARDANRPFRVRSGKTVIQAVGTQFNVNRLQSGTIVAVLEGKVRISPVNGTESKEIPGLTAGEVLRTNLDGKFIAHTTTDTAQMASWRQRRLHFSGDTLETIAEEFNRYNDKPIQVLDKAARARHFNGVFDADDPESFIEFLQRSGTLDVRTDGEAFVIRSR